MTQLSTALSPPEPAQRRILKRHPAATPSPLLEASVSLDRRAMKGVAGWRLFYELVGEVSALRIPAAQPPGPADGLWRHTCFEAFVALKDAKPYREFNFSPSGQWAHYAFSEERVRDLAAEAPLQSLAPQIEWNMAPGQCTLMVWLPADAWPQPGTGQALTLGISAVTETLEGQVHHWALHHPKAQPDFHHRESFAWTL